MKAKIESICYIILMVLSFSLWVYLWIQWYFYVGGFFLLIPTSTIFYYFYYNKHKETLPILLLLYLVVSLFIFIWDTFRVSFEMNMYIRYVEHKDIPNSNNSFVLFTDMAWFWDPGWYIFELEKGIDYSKLQISSQEGRDDKSFILFNYSEWWDHTSGAYIKIINEKYLLFSRWNLHHSLYDIKSKEVIVNMQSPWHEWRRMEDIDSSNQNREVIGEMIHNWKYENLHLKIQDIISNNIREDWVK